MFHCFLGKRCHFPKATPRVSRAQDLERPLNAGIVQEVKEKGVNLVRLKELVVREFEQLNLVFHAPNSNDQLSLGKSGRDTMGAPFEERVLDLLILEPRELGIQQRLKGKWLGFNSSFLLGISSIPNLEHLLVQFLTQSTRQPARKAEDDGHAGTFAADSKGSVVEVQGNLRDSEAFGCRANGKCLAV